MKKTILIIIILSISILFYSCTDECDNDGIVDNSMGISGEWHFLLEMEDDYIDTTNIKDKTEADFGSYESSVENIYLYEDNRGIIEGFCYPFKFRGSRDDKTVTLNVYESKEGEYDETNTIDEMFHVSTMEFEIDEFGNMNGYGTYLENENNPGVEQETYSISAHKIRVISYMDMLPDNPKSHHINASIVNTLCSEVGAIMNPIVKLLSIGHLRFTTNCTLIKDGGGYYLFGQEAPGMLPFLSSTIYYPYEWSPCNVRKYGFNISLKNERFNINTLKKMLSDAESKIQIAQKMGFIGLGPFVEAIESFNEKFGGFAISLVYNTATLNMSIYVNHEKGSSSEAQQHELTSTINSTVEQNAAGQISQATVYQKLGSIIYDEWHLRRSAAFVCNTPMIFVYLIGTHSVRYD